MIDLDELADDSGSGGIDEVLDLTDLIKSRKSLVKVLKSLPLIELIIRMPAERRQSMMLNVVNVLSCFAFLYRQFNSDIQNNSNEVCKSAYTLAPCLRNDWK